MHIFATFSLFYVLYPIGVAGEMKIIYDSLDIIAEREILSVSLPNRLNFAFNFHTWLVIVLLCYPLGLMVQYKHMMRQRRKVLAHETSFVTVTAKEKCL